MPVGTAAALNNSFLSKNLQLRGLPDYSSLITANLHLYTNNAVRFSVLRTANIDRGLPGTWK